MKKLFLLFVMSLSLVFIFGCTKNSKMAYAEDGKQIDYSSAEKVWSTADGLKIPESVMYDKKNDVLYVSSINGGSAEKNGKGFISKISTDGKVTDLEWVAGLNAPKGMGIMGDDLYVTDIDRFHVINIPNGNIKKTVTIDGAEFLNDIAVGDDGYVYITDMNTKIIHRFDSVKTENWLALKDYSRPNGLFMSGAELYIGTAEGILKCNTADGSIVLFIENTGGIDGIKAVGRDSFIVSDWRGKVQIVSKDKQPIILSDTSEDKINAADFEFIKETDMVYIPTFNNNNVVAYKIK